MTTIPGQLIKLRLLSNVPVSEYADIAPPKDATQEEERISFFRRLRKGKPTTSGQRNLKAAPKYIELNAAAWLSFDGEIKRPVSLWIKIEDDKGERSLLVDEQSVQGSDNTMLSGSVRFKAHGALKQVSACCGGLGNDDVFRVDELYVKRNYDAALSEGKMPLNNIAM